MRFVGLFDADAKRGGNRKEREPRKILQKVSLFLLMLVYISGREEGGGVLRQEGGRKKNEVKRGGGVEE